MSQAKRMRLVRDENLEMASDGSDTTQHDWGNLPYPVIHNIAKVLGFTISTGYTITVIVFDREFVNQVKHLEGDRGLKSLWK